MNLTQMRYRLAGALLEASAGIAQGSSAPQPFRWQRSSKAAFAGLLIFLWAFPSLLAANPSFHRWLHHDANQQHHECAIRLLEKQQVLSSDPVLTVADFDFGLNWQVEVCSSLIVAFADVRLSDSRASPVS